MTYKKIAATLISGLVLITCTITPAKSTTNTENTVYLNNINKDRKIFIEAVAYVKTQNRPKFYNLNYETMNLTIGTLNSYVGKTRYVRGGSTPKGWDCSGLVLWFYKQQGVKLPRITTDQAKTGWSTKNPKPGDIVAFRYNKSKYVYHTGIYIGSGLMIHSPKPGRKTQVVSIKEFAGRGSNVEYRTLVSIT
jgi:hypothetical protein